MCWKISRNGLLLDKFIFYLVLIIERGMILDPIFIKTIGVLAGTGTTVSFFPQMVRVLRTGSVSDLSLSMFLIHSTGVSLWIVYGILMGDLVVVIFNGATMLFNLVILSFFLQKCVFRKGTEQQLPV